LRDHGGRIQHLLEVVQQQQDPSSSKLLFEGLPDRSFPALLADPERRGDRRNDQGRIRHRCEVDEEGPVRDVAGDSGRDFQGETSCPCHRAR
jgi:hypothetical protein